MFRFLLSIAIFISVTGCVFDAPRDNPLDPVSSRYVANGAVNGRVVLKNQTNVGISSVFVKELLSGEATITDSLGFFTFSQLSVGSKSLVINKDGFVSDTVKFVVETGKQITVQSSLNAMPTVSNAIVLTRKIARYSQSNVYYASFTSSTFDANGIGDIDSVWLSIDTMKFPMDYSITDKNFHYTLYQNQLLSNNLQSIVGKLMKIVVRDAGKAFGESAPFFVSRIVEEEPKPLYPVSISSVDTTGLFPNFVWNEPKVNFNFSYTISLTRLFDGKVVWIKPNIASFLLNYQYDGTELLPGNYFWTLTIQDEFGNYSTSKEATFIAR